MAVRGPGFRIGAPAVVATKDSAQQLGTHRAVGHQLYTVEHSNVGQANYGRSHICNTPY